MKKTEIKDYIFKAFPKKQKICICLLLTAILVCLAVFIGSLITVTKANEYMRTHERTFAVVAFKDENDDFILQYSANSQSFDSVYRHPYPNTYIGETVEVYYESYNPEIYTTHSDSAFARRVLPTSAVIFAVLVFICLYIYIPLHNKYMLLENNVWKLCKVQKVKKLHFGRIRLIVDSSKFPQRKNKPFKSKAVKFDLLKNIKNSTVTVYYKNDRASVYYVDVKGALK